MNKRLAIICTIALLILTGCFLFFMSYFYDWNPIAQTFSDFQYNAQKNELILQFQENEKYYNNLIDSLGEMEWKEGGYHYLLNSDEILTCAYFKEDKRKEITLNNDKAKILSTQWEKLNENTKFEIDSIIVQNTDDMISVCLNTCFSPSKYYNPEVSLVYFKNEETDFDEETSMERLNMYWYFKRNVKI